MMNNTEKAEVLREIAAEMENRPWLNPRLGLRNDDNPVERRVCPVLTKSWDRILAADEDGCGIVGGGYTPAWNDDHDTKESVIADLCARADWWEAQPV